MSFPQVNGYDIIEKLGSGSYSTVYKAHKKGKPKDVCAIKCIDKQYHKKSFANNVIKEISLLKQLKHINIVDMKDFMWNTKHILIIMEYCDGGDLANLIRCRHKLKETVVKKLMQQLAHALQFLRENNVCHMDLKPQNLLLTWKPDLILKVADFGLSQHLTGEIEQCRFIGSPLYMAPEKLLNQKFDARVDLWSTGIIMFECLFGRPPYTNLNSQVLNLMAKQVPIELPKHSNITAECKDLLKCLLKHNSDQRIHFEEFFAHPFLIIENLSTEHAYQKALSLINEAIKLDKLEKFKESLPLYENAIKLIEPLVTAPELDLERRSLMKLRLDEYTSWAKTLREKVMKSNSYSSSVAHSVFLPNGDFEHLVNLCATTQILADALEIGKVGELYLVEGQCAKALCKLKAALSILVPAIQNEPSGERKKLLHAQIQTWLKMAETLSETNPTVSNWVQGLVVPKE